MFYELSASVNAWASKAVGTNVLKEYIISFSIFHNISISFLNYFVRFIPVI